VEQSIKKLYYSISEVSKITGLKPYVLRYWETEFKQLAPPKNRAGNRTFRQKDIDLILRLRQLLHVEKFTIEGARKKLSERVEVVEAEIGEKSVETNPEECEAETLRRKKMLRYVKQELESMMELLQR